MSESTHYYCEVLSTRMHRFCPWRHCECPCHLRGGLVSGFERMRRPHSFSKERWGRMSRTDRLALLARKRQSA